MRRTRTIVPAVLLLFCSAVGAQSQIAQSDRALCDLVRTSARAAMANRQSGMERQKAAALNRAEAQKLGDSGKEKFIGRLIEQTVITVYENDRIAGQAEQDQVIEVFGRAAEEVCLENIGQQ